MRVTLLSANIGEIDGAQKIVPQSTQFDYEYRTDKGAFMSDRMASKFYKSAYVASLASDVVIWIDGCVDVLHPDFIEWCLEEIDGYDFAVPLHEERYTVAEEYLYILPRLDSSYLGTRYKDEPWDDEIEWAKRKNGLDSRLVNPRVFIARLNDKTKALLKSWWDLIILYTVFDQTQLSVMLDHHRDVNVNYLHWPNLRRYVRVNSHIRVK